MQDENTYRSPEPDVEVVPVFRTGDQAKILVARSLLESEGIDFLVRGEGLQDLFGWDRLLTPFNYAVGPVEFAVRKDEAERARELLQGLEASTDTQSGDAGGG